MWRRCASTRSCCWPEVDLNSIPAVVAEFAGVFPRAEFVSQPAAGHYPWLDDADRFVTTTATFLN